MRYISTLSEVAECVAKIDSVHGAARGEAFGEFQYVLDSKDLIIFDPYSEDYRNKVLEKFNNIHSDIYHVDLESNVFAYHSDDPFPFSSRSPFEVGRHFGAIYTILRDFPVVPPARVLDVGSGWGHTTIALARTGFDVDPLDINAGYLDLIRYWASQSKVADRVNPINSSFGQIASLDKKYDAILFFESFHHSLDHKSLLEGCVSRLTPKGVIVFAGEPIYPDWFSPWCVRTSIDAIYCIHKLGWMELGFREDYFLGLLARSGLYAERRRYTDHPIADGYVARQVGAKIQFTSLALPQPYESTWHDPESSFRWTKARSTLPGYIFYGRNSFVIAFSNLRPASMDVVVQVNGITCGQRSYAPGESSELIVHFHGNAEEVSILSTPWRPCEHGMLDERALGIAVSALGFP